MRLLLKYYGKSILRWAGKKAMQRVQKQFTQRPGTGQENTVSEGETQVRQNPQATAQPKGKANKTVGEYVDYEEID